MLKEITKNALDINSVSASVTTFKSVIMKFLPSQDANSNSQSSEIEFHQAHLAANSKINSLIQKADTTTSKVFVSNSVKNQTFQKETSQINSIQDTSSNRIFEYEGYKINAHSRNAESVTSNFLLSIPTKNISNHYNELIINNVTKSTVTKNDTLKTTQATIIHKDVGYQGTMKVEASLNWLPGLLLLSLFTFSWVKLIYQKYVLQVVTSTVNYQVSLRLLREKNVLFRNMAIGLNFVFAINLGLLIFYYLQFNNINQLYSNNLINVILYSGGIILLYNVKTFLCKVIGNIFMVKEQFSEYVHNINLSNKNLGLFLFPIVIIFPYVADNHTKAIVLYTGLIVFISMLLLLIYRGIQIIMRNGVSTFYLILYLCAVEILPILLLIKYSYT